MNFKRRKMSLVGKVGAVMLLGIGFMGFSPSVAPNTCVVSAAEIEINESFYFPATKTLNIPPIQGGDTIKISLSDDIKKQVENVRIANGITVLPKNAFRYFSKLTSVTIPPSVISIEECAFLCCESLTSVTIPSSVISVEECAFLCCESLTSATIPPSVISIGDWAFAGTDLTSVEIPPSVISIGENAFRSCKNLTSVSLPQKFIGNVDNIFFDCSIPNILFLQTERKVTPLCIK